MGEVRDAALGALLTLPTRRSSDLVNMTVADRVVTEQPPWTPSDPLGEALHRLRMRGTFYCRAEVRDRKSTRLNSSHVAISYAVFCLKKKTTVSSSTLPNIQNPRDS